MNARTLSNRRFGAALLVILGALLAISPAGTRTFQPFNPADIVAAIESRSDHVTAEDLARWIIDKRPDFLVVDIRSSEEYSRYHIPGAMNIPLGKLFDEESLELLDTDQIIVLYSNGGTHAAQAWVLLQQLGIESYVLLGGLNYWTEAILNPTPPSDLVADSEILRYQFRKAASAYFAGSGVAIGSTDGTATGPKPKPRVPLRRKRKKKADEGC